MTEAVLTAETDTHRPTKSALIQRMLAGPEGATMAAFSQATDWQAHIVRAALTRLRQAGHAVERSRSETAETVYRIIGTDADAASKAPGPGEQAGTLGYAEAEAAATSGQALAIPDEATS